MGKTKRKRGAAVPRQTLTSLFAEMADLRAMLVSAQDSIEAIRNVGVSINALDQQQAQDRWRLKAMENWADDVDAVLKRRKYLPLPHGAPYFTARQKEREKRKKKK